MPSNFRLFASIAAADDPARAGAAAAGAIPILDLDAGRFAIDDEHVRADPDAFAIRRDSAPHVVGGGDRPVQGEARARLVGGVGDAMAAVIAGRIAAAAQGVPAIRLRGIEADGPGITALARAIHLALPDTLLVADVAGEGVDGVAVPAGAWDVADRALVETIEAVRPNGVPVAEVLAHDLHDADDPARIARRLLVAAGIASGAIVPAALLADRGLANRLRALGDRAAATPGEIRSLTGPAAPVTALLRVDTADVRDARVASVLLVNRTDREQPAPDAALLLAGAGVDLRQIARTDGRGDPFAALGPAEVRSLSAKRGKPIMATLKRNDRTAREAAAWPRLVIQDVTPAVAGGDFPVKRTVGEVVEVEAIVFADGHEQLAAELCWRVEGDDDWVRVAMTQHPNDRWTAAFQPTRLGRHEYLVEAWHDVFGGFRRDFAKKLDASVAQPVDHAEGVELVRAAAGRGHDLADWLRRIDAGDEDGAASLLDPALAAAMARADHRPHRLRSPRQLLDAERLQARFSSWYELFPRSMSGTKDRHGTFRDVIDHLPRVRAMGFDTLYFPPIHPIGTANRKGPNNTLTPAEGDPGSPYAIGAAAGGHDAIHPELGTFEDFRALVGEGRRHGLEIAIDFAIQCSPDHPWLKAHPGWFARRPDGSMKYAENPPKKYQDIVNVDFYGPDAVPGLWLALRDVVLLWCREGVKTFRVDNPHTKPLPFWQWMIGEVRRQHPDAIFLAEAFTRPSMMYRLAKIGFSQSYTYFTWRDHKAELTDYIVELTTEAPKEFYRPHFFVSTPDINPYFLQTSGRPGFRIRAVLAATLSGLFGVYSGFELCEGAPLPGKEEYLDSEKYELRPRDWNAPGNIVADITLFNRLRRAHPALQTHLNTRFYAAGNDRIIYYGKPEPDGAGLILVMVSLDPHGEQATGFEVPLWDLGLPDDATVAVEDLGLGYRFDWTGKAQTITLAPDEPYRIWRIAPKENA